MLSELSENSSEIAFFQDSAKGKMIHFNISVAVKRRRDKN